MSMRDLRVAALGAALLALVVTCWVGSTTQQQLGHFGDDPEYLTMVYSLLRHGSPRFVEGDDVAMLESLPRKFRRTLAGKFKEGAAPAGYYKALDGGYYGWHFFAYSALVTPVRALLGHRSDAHRAHQYTNLIIVSLALLSVIQLRDRLQVALGLIALASITPVLWFLPYAHTEPFAFGFGVLAITFYMRRRPLAAITCAAIAATQFQPLAPLAWFLAAEWLWQHRDGLLDRRTRLRASLMGCAALALASITLLPGVFYLSHFGTPNLIAREGLASASLMSSSKLLWMFIDPNGGMLAYAPGLLLLTLVTAVRAGMRAVRGARDSWWSLGVLACALFEMYASTCQRNWNHPTFGVSRYVVYTIAPLLFFLTRELLAKERAPLVCASVLVALALQLGVHAENGFFAYHRNDSAHHSRLAMYVMTRWPTLYSPPPEIFCERTLRRCPLGADANPVSELYPIVWRDASGKPREVLTDCNAAHTLDRQAWTVDERTKLERALKRCTAQVPMYIAL